MQADWASLPPPLLQQVLWLALRDLAPLQLPLFLKPGTTKDADARYHAAAIAELAAVCRAWRAAAALGCGGCATWCVDVQHTAGVDLLRLERLRVASLDLRVLTWSEADGGAGCEALLASPAFRAASGRHLTSIDGVPERLAPLLAGFPNLEAVGLAEDYTSTAFGVAGPGEKSHLAAMRLRPLHCLPMLRQLTLELGVADLASLPPQVKELVLMEVDRVVLPAGTPGGSVADRLLAAAEAAGLVKLTVRASSGNIVFEEPHHAPLELELSHLARLLLAQPVQRCCVSLTLYLDDILDQVLPSLHACMVQPHVQRC